MPSTDRYLAAVPQTRRSATAITASSAPTPTVFVVDRDVSVQEAVVRTAGAAGWRVETFDSADRFLARPRSPDPSCVVLDVALPDMHGLDVQLHLADRPETPIIFVTSRGDVQTAVRAMKAGAAEFLTKPFGNDELAEAIRSAVDRSRATLHRQAEGRALRSRYRSLTPRERDVMALVVSGLLNKQVGGELGISEITVKAHRGQVMRKMQADSLPALVTMAARLGPLLAVAVNGPAPPASASGYVQEAPGAGRGLTARSFGVPRRSGYEPPLRSIR